MNILAVIPARYASTRLPGKALIQLQGKPMIQHVWERVREAKSLSGVLVATDDERIAAAVAGFGGEAVLTRAEHRSGTERVAEVAATRPAMEICLVNVQGDAPRIDPAAIDELVAAIRDDDAVNVATLAVPIEHPPDIMDPNVVKAVLDFDGNALYFSRAPIPGSRPRRSGGARQFLKHLPHLRVSAAGAAGVSDVPSRRLRARGAAGGSCAGSRTATRSRRGRDGIRFDRRGRARRREARGRDAGAGLNFLRGLKQQKKRREILRFAQNDSVLPAAQHLAPAILFTAGASSESGNG